MHVLPRGRRLPATRVLLCLGALLAALAIAGPLAGTASACSGSKCPGSGYTLDWNWNCGAIPDTGNCVGLGGHTWGWASAAYNGSGNAYICAQLAGNATSCGYNLARVCYYANCNDQNVVTFSPSVSNWSGYTHTILGHSLA